MKNEKEQLQILRQEMEHDHFLPFFPAKLVFGEGNVNAKLCFIGEAPGAKEEELGRPFIGRSGKLLERQLLELGIDRKEVYITNIIKHRPPENRDPKNNELELYRPYLERQLEIIEPQVIITLGRFAYNYFFPQAKISQNQGKIISYQNFYLLPLFHPAATFRNNKTKKDFQEGFIVLKQFLKTLKNKHN